MYDDMKQLDFKFFFNFARVTITKTLNDAMCPSHL